MMNMTTARDTSIMLLVTVATVILLVIAVSPTTYGAWEAKVHIGFDNAMQPYWDQIECDSCGTDE
jgi:hypothetical protein